MITAFLDSTGKKKKGKKRRRKKNENIMQLSDLVNSIKYPLYCLFFYISGKSKAHFPTQEAIKNTGGSWAINKPKVYID